MSDPRRQRWLAITTRTVACVLVLGVAWGLTLLLTATPPKPATVDTSQALPRVVVMRAQQVAVRRPWQGFGVAQAKDSADVPARVTATVSLLPENTQEGRSVAQGQLIAQLDEDDFRQEVGIAQQTLAALDAQLAMLQVEQLRLIDRLALESRDVVLAQDELGRIEQLRARGAGHPQEVDAAKRMVIAAQRTHLLTKETLDMLPWRRDQLQAQRAGQQASLVLAQQNLSRCRITSPIDGVLQAVDVEVGESLSVGQRVARVVDLRRVEVPLRLPASARGQVVLGDELRLTTTNRSGQTWPARIARIMPEDDPDTRTVTVLVEVDQPDAAGFYGRAGGEGLLTPGVFLSATLAARDAQQRWVVPRRAVRDGRVLLVDHGQIRSRPVRVDYAWEGRLRKLGVPDEQWVVLADALGQGDLVVVNAAASVLDGQKVQPVLPDAPKPDHPHPPRPGPASSPPGDTHENPQQPHSRATDSDHRAGAGRVEP